MDATGMIIEYLKQKHDITSLEKDILDTWNELTKYPFDMSSAQKKIVSNYASHPDIYALVNAQPQTVIKPPEQITEMDFRYVLESQLAYLIKKEGQALNNGR